MDRNLLTLFSRVRLPNTENIRVSTASRQRVSALNLELAYFGYSFDQDMMHRVAHLDSKTFGVFRQKLINMLGEVTGDSYSHTTLFSKFPYDTPDQHEYFVRRVIGHLGNIIGITEKDHTVLSCGHVINHSLFNLDDFGVCPICQFQVDELKGNNDHEVSPFENISPLKKITFASEAFIKNAAETLIARPDSLNQNEKSFLLSVIREYGITVPENISFREQMPYAFLANPRWFDDKTLTATDILRLAAFVSNPDTVDLSLKANPKFDLSTSQKKAILRMLERIAASENVLEDMMRNRERWLRLGERLNPNSEKNKKNFPNTAVAFDMLRNKAGDIATFGRVVHQLSDKIADKNVVALAHVLKERSGEFARRLDFMLRNASRKDANIIVDMFVNDVVGNLSTKMLFELSKYFDHRNGVNKTNHMRAFYPKGNSNRVHIIEDMRAGIEYDYIIAIQKEIEIELNKRFSIQEKIGNVYIDPELKGIIMPFNARGDSSTNTAMVKGAQYPLDNGDVLRFFIHWTGNTDLDLSAMLYNDDSEVVNSIGFYNTGSTGSYAVHSGDVQNAPNGASEFIDININKAIKAGIRYVAMQVNSFRGEKFTDFDAFAGYMMRDASTSGKKYEPASVRLKFALTSETTTTVALLFDIVDRKVIFTDMPSSNLRHAVTARQNKKIVNTMSIMFDMVNRKPTMYDVLETVMSNRGVIVQNKEDASMVFDATINPDSVLEYLK